MNKPGSEFTSAPKPERPDAARRDPLPTVLVPLDGSATALAALPVAQAIAGLTGATIHLVHVAEAGGRTDGARVAIQSEPRGTGDAVSAGLTVASATAERVLVVGGDTPLVTDATLRAALQRVRGYVQRRALLEIWLYFHIPLTFVLIVALLAHIISVFFYW